MHGHSIPRSVVARKTWDFLQPVLVACVIASIAGFYVIQRYFGQFSSRAEVPFWIYLAVALGTALVLTVAVQCHRAANADPVKSLRYE